MEQSKKLQTAMKARDWDAAETALAAMEKSSPEDANIQFASTRLQILLGRKDYDGAYKLAKSMSAAHPENSLLQNELAWTLVTTRDLDQHGLALAKSIAERASAAAKEIDPGILDTLARAQFMNGLTNEAVATEQKAVDLAPDSLKNELKKCLADYQQGKLPDQEQ